MSQLTYKSPLSRQITGFIFLAMAFGLFMIWREKSDTVFLIACSLMTFVSLFKTLTFEESLLKKGEAKAKKRTHYMGFFKHEEQCDFDTVDMMCNDHMLARWQVFVTQSDEMMKQTLSPEQVQKIKNKEAKQPGFVIVDGISRAKAQQAIKDIRQHCQLSTPEEYIIKKKHAHLKMLPHHEEWELKKEHAHPQAIELLTEDLYWDFLNEDAPFGNDTAVDILTDYSTAFEKNHDLDDFIFLQSCFQAINKKRQKIEVPTDKIRAEFAQESDETCIALCFSTFILKGQIHPQVKALALQSLENQLTEENFETNKGIALKVEAMEVTIATTAL